MASERLDQASATCQNYLGYLGGIEKQLTTEIDKRDKNAAILQVAPAVKEAIEKLTLDLFSQETAVIRTAVDSLLRAVMSADLEFTMTPKISKNALEVELGIRRGGREEDLIRAQGGSVANVVEAGLRLVAIKLQGDSARQFVVLDEPDCWLAPEIVPRFAEAIADVARNFDFQVLYITHHDVSRLRDAADRIIELKPSPEGIQTEVVFERSVVS